MKKFIICYTGIFISVVFLVPFSWAKTKTFNIDKLSFSYEVPRFKGATTANVSGVGMAQKWGQLETLYESYLSWADDITFHYYILLEDKHNKDVMFSDAVTYMNIPEGKGNASYMYIHPYAIARYGKVKNFRVEIWYDGIMVDEGEWPAKGTKQWWNKTKGITGNLLIKYFTPFTEQPSREGQIKFNFK